MKVKFNLLISLNIFHKIDSTQCAKDCGPHNRACEYGCAHLHGSQFLAHAVDVSLSYSIFYVARYSGHIGDKQN